MIDLHTHSTCSDGSLAPAQLAEAGLAAGLSAMALTDHDTTAGVASFLEACRVLESKGKGRLTGVAGVEVSVDVSKGTLHMLGYFVNPGSRELEEMLERIRLGRDERNGMILEKLAKLGMVLKREEVAQFAGGEVVGRPHVAQAMQARGWVSSVKEAFDRFLGKGKPAYAERLRLSVEESVATIRAAGGLPVLAHPFTLGLDTGAMEEYVGKLAALGLEGIEAFYTEHRSSETETCLRIAGQFHLAVTGGTDFHGVVTPDIRLGRGFGNLNVGDEVFDALCRRRNAAGSSGKGNGGDSGRATG